MNSRLTDEFRSLFRRLPIQVQEQARKAYQTWRTNSAHPSLRFKKIHKKESIYSVRIGLGWRAVGLIDGDTMTWFWIGSHAEYDKLLET